MKLKKLFGKILGAGLCMGMLLGCMPGGALQVKAATQPNYLTFTAEEAGSTLSLSWASASDVQTSTDHGTTWSAYARGTTITLANVGDSVSFKGRGFVANNSANVNHVKMTGKIAASGSVTSLIDENGGDPNVTLPNDCFAHMFQDCTSLTQAPELPATTLSDICYVYMFQNCTSLTQVPKLPATTLDVACYHSMFEGCTGLSLTTTKDADHTLAWSVPDTTADLNWNLNMFAGCPNVDLGNGSKEPQMNTVYYQTCNHSYGSDGKCIYLKKAAQGEYTEALALIKKQNPFPAVCGRICNRRCEDACTRGTIDEPIAIDAVKRFIAERDLHADTRYVPPIVVPASIHKNGWEEKIAIIGGGPAGLSCAFYLAERGYKPTVFEKNENAGGMLRYGIPSYKLEKDVIEAEIDIMREMGVEIKTGVEVGKDISLDELRAQGYKAFYIAIGCSAGRRPGVPGDDAEGTFTAIDYLKNANCGGADYNGRVVVVGGGNVAIDAARVSARNGASEVTQLCLESEKEMPASDEEVREAGEDGVTIKCGWGPKEVLVTDGKVSGIIFKKCVSVFEEVDGRKKFAPKYDESETITIDCDRVIFAVGQQSVWGDLLKSEDVEFRGPALVADGLTYQVQGAPDLFIGGDVMTGPKFAIDAIAAGHWASESLHRYVQNGHMTIGRNKWEFIELNKDDILVESYDNSSRQSEGFDETLGNKSFKDAHIALTEEQVKIETSRCLGCGATIVDANKCIGCGVCTTKCAFDAITLHRDHPECSTMVTAEDKFKAIIPYELKRAVKIVFAPKTAEEKAAIKAHKEAMQNK